MTSIKHAVSLCAATAVFAATLTLAVPAQAGSYTVAPGATTQIDVADRSGYTTITVINSGSIAGSLQLPTGGASIAVPANGRTELYDRYGRAYIAVTNTGSVPLQVISRYQVTIPLP